MTKMSQRKENPGLSELVTVDKCQKVAHDILFD